MGAEQIQGAHHMRGLYNETQQTGRPNRGEWAVGFLFSACIQPRETAGTQSLP